MKRISETTSVGKIARRLPGAHLAARVRRFGRAEDGVLVAFGVFLILMMLMVGGLGVDIMRFEMTRSKLQHTLDRAVLAAADLDQELDPRDVVNDYFFKSDLSGYLTSVTVDQGLNYREVSATAEMEMNTQIIHMLGVDKLTAPASGAAAESVDGVEISLVLDISGSMNSNNRLSNLRVAAKEFVSSMLNSSPAGDVSISIVPYATQVNIGPTLAQHFNLTNEHNYSHCVNFNTPDFSITAINPTDPLERAAPFDPWYSYESRLILPVCPEDPASMVKAFSIDQAELESYINNLNAGGNTSIDLGVKWGTALLEPALRPVVDQMITDGDVDPALGETPRPFNGDALKILIVMSDGQNTQQYYMKDHMRDGLTDVWYYEGDYDHDGIIDRIYSVKEGSTYYYKRPSGSYAYWHYPYSGSEPFMAGDAQRLSYPDLFHQATNYWISNQLYGGIWPSTSANDYWRSRAFDYKAALNKDQWTTYICNAAKDAGIIIFTIGFEAPWRGQELLKNCASSDGHYFDVNGIEISDAFASIASSVSTLRLIQ